MTNKLGVGMASFVILLALFFDGLSFGYPLRTRPDSPSPLLPPDLDVRGMAILAMGLADAACKTPLCRATRGHDRHAALDLRGLIDRLSRRANAIKLTTLAQPCPSCRYQVEAVDLDDAVSGDLESREAKQKSGLDLLTDIRKQMTQQQEAIEELTLKLKKEDETIKELQKKLKIEEEELDNWKKSLKNDDRSIEELREVICTLLAALCQHKGSPCLTCPWVPTPISTQEPSTPEAITTEPTTTKLITTEPITTPETPTSTISSTTTSLLTTAEPIPQPTSPNVTTTAIAPNTTEFVTTSATITTTKSTANATTTTPAHNTTTSTVTTKTTTTKPPKPSPDPKATCEKPKAPEHGFIVGNKTTLGSEVKVECQQGYTLVGVPTMECTALWSDETKSYSYNWAPPMSAVCKAIGGYKVKEKKADKDDKPQKKDSRPKRNANEAKKTKAACSLPRVVGPCRASFPRFFYNSSSGKCERFTYGGCQGNANNFNTIEECHNLCSDLDA